MKQHKWPKCKVFILRTKFHFLVKNWLLQKVFTSPRWNSWSVQTASWWLSLEYLFLSPGSYSMWILTILFVFLMIQLNISCFGPKHLYSHLKSQLRPCFGGRLLHVRHRHIDPLRSHDIIFFEHAFVFITTQQKYPFRNSFSIVINNENLSQGRWWTSTGDNSDLYLMLLIVNYHDCVFLINQLCMIDWLWLWFTSEVSNGIQSWWWLLKQKRRWQLSLAYICSFCVWLIMTMRRRT